MNKPPLEIADVLREGFSDYNETYGPLQPDQYKVANAIMACRTAALGGHIDKCDQCSHERISYNSCRNRHCPKCQALARAQWVELRMRDLLPVPYFHAVFTLPAQLNAFALRNKKVFYGIFFEAVSETLQTFAHDQKYLGGEIGVISILHTWGQNLLDHPHIHCVVPGGGLIGNSRWQHCGKGFLFPVKAMSAVFKGKMLDYFKTAVENHEIELSGSLQQYASYVAFSDLLTALYKTQWIVYVKPPFAGPKAVLKYLGRYTHRVAISNNRLTSLTDSGIAFRWKDYADHNRQKIMTLSLTEFIRRFLLHVIPGGFVRIRYYGFLSNRCRKEKLKQCMKNLGVKPPEDTVAQVPQSRHWYDIVKWLTGKDPTICPVCGKGHMRTYREIARSPVPLERWEAA